MDCAGLCLVPGAGVSASSGRRGFADVQFVFGGDEEEREEQVGR
jgi:hypothetical protein